jgi:hypothetical protein
MSTHPSLKACGRSANLLKKGKKCLLTKGKINANPPLYQTLVLFDRIGQMSERLK